MKALLSSKIVPLRVYPITGILMQCYTGTAVHAARLTIRRKWCPNVALLGNFRGNLDLLADHTPMVRNGEQITGWS
jgi:hypothetical protein